MEHTVISFDDEAARDGLVFRKYPPGTVLRLDPEDCVAVLRDGGYTVNAPLPGECFTCPAEGESFAVRCRETVLRFGFRDLGSYTLANVPGRSFPLGFYGSMKVRSIYVGGLLHLMRRQPELSFSWLKRNAHGEDTVPLLQIQPDELNRQVQKMVEALAGERPEISALEACRPVLEQKLEELLFARFFDKGLLLHSGSLRVEGFSRPMVDN